MRQAHIGEEERGVYVRLRPRVQWVNVPYVLNSVQSRFMGGFPQPTLEALIASPTFGIHRYSFDEAVKAGIVKAEDYE